MLNGESLFVAMEGKPLEAVGPGCSVKALDGRGGGIPPPALSDEQRRHCEQFHQGCVRPLACCWHPEMTWENYVDSIVLK